MAARLQIQLLVLICAASAGVHAVLAPAHFRETPPLGLGFRASAIALAAVAIALDRRPESTKARHVAALLLGALILAYAATRVAAVPFLGEHKESLDAVGVVTKLFEALGLTLAIKPINQQVVGRKAVLATEKGVTS
jgi:hypothetical protein